MNSIHQLYAVVNAVLTTITVSQLIMEYIVAWCNGVLSSMHSSMHA